MLQVTNLSVEIGGKTTLARASFTVHAGEKVGLVGRNGAGKTTLFKTLGGEHEPAGGTITRKGAFGYLPQDPKADPRLAMKPAFEYVLSGRGLDRAMVDLEKLRIAVEENPTDARIARYAKAEEQFAAMGGYAAEAEVRKLIAGVGLKTDRADMTLNVLSGGERRRVELARILYAGSDLLLLDEPTNHLDTDAKQWLATFLRAYRGALVVISHDLDLLDESINRVLHLDEAEIHEYKGTYSQYVTARAADEERQRKISAQQSSEMQRLSHLADSMRGQTARRARVAKALDRRVEKIAQSHVDAPTATHTSEYKFPDPPHCGRTVLECTDLSKRFGTEPVFEKVSFAIERGERMLVIGLNGAGKTTLLKLLSGELVTDTGDISLGRDVSPGHYAQEHDTIVSGVSVVDHVRSHMDVPDSELRALLGMFDLYGDMAFQDAATLSGGEKTKLALAQLVAGKHNLLLLDEPTNNLDPPSLEAIGTALSSWKGAMVLVSHDARFVERLAPQRVLFMPEGTLDYWRPELIELVEMA